MTNVLSQKIISGDTSNLKRNEAGKVPGLVAVRPDIFCSGWKLAGLPIKSNYPYPGRPFTEEAELFCRLARQIDERLLAGATTIVDCYCHRFVIGQIDDSDPGPVW